LPDLKILTQILLHVQFEYFEVLVLVEPLVNVEIKIAAVADGFRLDHFDIGTFTHRRELHNIIDALLGKF
jgi:hypothetical protein